jgi:hypothetical protein
MALIASEDAIQQATGWRRDFNPAMYYLPSDVGIHHRCGICNGHPPQAEHVELMLQHCGMSDSTSE